MIRGTRCWTQNSVRSKVCSGRVMGRRDSVGDNHRNGLGRDSASAILRGYGRITLIQARAVTNDVEGDDPAVPLQVTQRNFVTNLNRDI